MSPLKFCQYSGCIQPAEVLTLQRALVCSQCIESTVLTWLLKSYPEEEIRRVLDYYQASHHALFRTVRVGQALGMSVQDFNLMWSSVIDRCEITRLRNVLIHVSLKLSPSYAQVTHTAEQAERPEIS